MKSKNIINEDLRDIGSKALKVAGKVAKWAPVVSAPLAAQEVYARQQAGDTAGAAIAGASALPIVGIPADVVQAARDKMRTGSFLPEPAEIQAAVEKEKKEPKAKFDPGFLPESLKFSAALAEDRQHRKQLRRVDRIYEELRIYKLHYNRYLAEGTNMSDVMFVYVNEAGIVFDEQGDVIAEGNLGAALDLGKRGWQGIKGASNWAAKNVPPAYRAVKSGIGKAASEIGDVYQGVKKGVGAVASELVDVPVAVAKKVKGGYQDVRYSTTDPLEISKIQTARSAADTAGKLGDIEVTTAKGVGKQTVRSAKGKADVDVGTGQQAMTAAEIAAGNKPWISPRAKTAKKAVAGTTAGVGAADTALRYDQDKNELTGGLGSGFGAFLPEETYAEKLKKWLSGDKPAAEPAKPPAAEKPKPVKPADDISPEEERSQEQRLSAAGDKRRQQQATGSDQVRAMQQKLAAAGYGKLLGAPGVDGKWGKRTQAAYDAYKADKNLKRAEQPDADSLERERIAAQSNRAQAPAGTNVNKIDVDTLQKDYPRAAAVTEPVTRSTPWGGIQTPPDAIEKVIQAGQRRAQDMARIRSQSLEPTSGPALNTNSVPYAVDQEATDARDRLAARLKEDLQDMLTLSGLQGK